MAAITSTQSGPWSDTGTWVGGVVPADGDAGTIALGHEVVFDVDQSGFAGLAGLVVTGTLRFSTAGRTCLKMNGNVSGAGSIYVGNSEADPIPITADETPEMATLLFASGNITFTGTFRAYGEERIGFDYAAATQIAADSIITLTTGLTLRAGDVVVLSRAQVGGTPTTHTVSSYDAGTKVVTFSAPLGRTVAVNDVLMLLSRNIYLANAAGGAPTFAANGGIAYGVRFGNGGNVGNGLLSARTGWQFGYCSGWAGNGNWIFSYQGSGHTFYRCNAYGRPFATANTLTLTECCGMGLANLVNNTAIGNKFYRCVTANATSGITNAGVSAYLEDCTSFYGSTGGLLVGCCLCVCVRCVSRNARDGGLSYGGGGHTFIDCQSLATQHGDLNGCGDAALKNCLMDATEEVMGALLLIGQTIESLDHDQVAGAYRCWSVGGVTSSVASPVPTGRTCAYNLVCQSASGPVFWQRKALVEPGQTLTLNCWLRKDGAMSYLPRAQIVDPYADPQVIAAAVALAEWVMTDSVDEWEQAELTWINPADVPAPVLIRIQAMNASGNVYSDMEVASAGGSVIVIDD